MNRSPEISVLLPVFNGLPHLDACLRSLSETRGVRFEVLVGDDGSSDGSAALLDTYLRYPWFSCERGPRKGLFANLNRLIDRAQAPLVRILCQDDLIEPNALYEEVRFFDQHPAIGMSYCKSRMIDIRDQVIEESDLKDLPAELSPKLAAQHFFYHGCIPGNLSTVCARREVLQAERFDTSFAVSADYEMWTRLCRERPLGVIQKHLVQIRLHPQQLSARPSSQVKFLSENRRIRRRLIPYLPPQVQADAHRYERMRHDAIDFHGMLRLALAGKIRDAWAMALAFGGLRMTRAFFYWLVSANNRLYRPQARWVLDAPPVSLPRSDANVAHS